MLRFFATLKMTIRLLPVINFRFLFFLLVPVIIWGQVNTEKYRSAADTTGFTLQSEIDMKLQKGNVDFQEMSIESLAQYKFVSGRMFFVISGDLGWESGRRFSNTMLAHLRYVKNISKILQLEFFVQTDYDKSRLLDGRLIAGAGPRWRLWNKPKEGLWIGNSLFYEQEKYSLSANAKHEEKIRNVRFSTYLSFIKSLRDFADLNTVFYFQPQFSDWDDFKIVGESGLVIKLTKHLSMDIKFIYRFDNKPPDSIKKEDITLENGLIITF
jgi:hypothetical protein